MRSLLLAAGRGDRLRPLTDSCPKPCLPLLDVPLGAWPLTALLEEASPVVVNVSHLAREAIGGLGLRERRGVDVLVERPVALGTAGTLAALRHRVDERVLTCNADLLTDLRPGQLLETHAAKGVAASIAVTPVPEGADVTVVKGEVTAFIDRRADPGRAGMRFVGMAVFDEDVLGRLRESPPSGIAESLLRPLAGTGELAVHEHRGYALDVGTPHRFVGASLDVLNGRAPTPPDEIPGQIVEVAGGVAYLGPAARALGSLGEGAILLRGARVDEGARVERAIIWPGERVPRGTIVRDAVWFRGRMLDARPLP